jgi:hypothetical protein
MHNLSPTDYADTQRKAFAALTPPGITQTCTAKDPEDRLASPISYPNAPKRLTSCLNACGSIALSPL